LSSRYCQVYIYKVNLLIMVRYDGPMKQELEETRVYVSSHRLLPAMIEFLNSCKKEGVTPSAQILCYLENVPQPGSIDFSLDDFLASQGIAFSSEVDDYEVVRFVEHLLLTGF
jgi:hypothetical protein